MEKEKILSELNTIGAGDSVHVAEDDGGNLTATVAGAPAKSLSIRLIDGFSNRELSCRLIKDKQGRFDVLFSNLPDVVEVINLNDTCREFVEKYFLSNYIRKLLTLPNLNNITDILTPQNGGNAQANPLSKPFNALVKALVVSLKANMPAKASLINEKTIKTFLADLQTANLILGQTTVKGKAVAVADYIKALIKWHCEKESPNAVNFAHGVTFTPDDYIGYAVALAAKAVDRKVETSIDEDDLDI
jgi:hypothetical protein